MSDPGSPTGRVSSAEINRRRRGRSWAILLVLLGLCALFYAITVVKMAHP
jgi:hypothetical protein